MDKVGVAATTEHPPLVAGYGAVRCLGKGANGSVWLLAPDDGGACLAAKILTVGGGVRADTNEVSPRHNDSQITHEWRVLAQFRHDHLIPVHGVVRDSLGSQVLLMDHAGGGSLEQVVRARGTLEVGEAVTVLTPMGQVLAFLHARGAVHGDVSPGNVLLSSAGKPLLSDFGFGRVLGQGAESVAGTPGFSCSHDTHRDAAADVYALASVGWYALTGRAAPRTRDRLPLGTLLQDVPHELVAALEAGLNEDPALRPTAAAFAQAVFRSATALPVALGHAVHPSVLPELLTRKDAKERRGKRVPRRRRRWWARLPLPRWLPLHAIRLEREGKRMGQLWGSEVATPRRHMHGHGSDAGRGAGHAAGLRVRVRPRRRAAMLAAGAALVLCLFVLVVHVAQGGGFSTLAPPGQDQHSSTFAPGTVDSSEASWVAALPAKIQNGLAQEAALEALPALAWLRSYALSSADSDLLEKVNVPGSPAWEADTAVMASLLERGHSFTGLETSIVQAGIVQADAGAPQMTVQATVATSPFAELDASGNVVHQQETEQQQALRIVMSKTGGRWMIEQILAVDEHDGAKK
ncbi:serine/threonine-protein kinase [Arthrobacter sp.]|uniref:serine/threonine protein kinase n=1 Tax=Arthrobacter sp. TaxID=1667 RepID=UPI0026DF0FBB|nr:serine/threonine-protein kinase [Arthrobacter sp.]MDO5753994.1 serine/threonine-protein kinase [Arthrobacter sp.]